MEPTIFKCDEVLTIPARFSSHDAYGLRVLIVTGPCSVQEYHVNSSPELLIQLSGAAAIKYVCDGRELECELEPGQIVCIPPGVPHLPIRSSGSIGIVVELANPSTAATYHSLDQLLHSSAPRTDSTR